jgi:hypothetical protein
MYCVMVAKFELVAISFPSSNVPLVMIISRLVNGKIKPFCDNFRLVN